MQLFQEFVPIIFKLHVFSKAEHLLFSNYSWKNFAKAYVASYNLEHVDTINTHFSNQEICW